MKGKFTMHNAKDTGKVLAYVALSGALTALIDFMPNVELGIYAPLVMGGLNVLHVAVKNLMSNK